MAEATKEKAPTIKERAHKVLETAPELGYKEVHARLGGVGSLDEMSRIVKEWKKARAGSNGATAPAKAAGDIRMVPLEALRTDGGTQMRPKLSQAAIDRYQEAYDEGEELPPLEAVEDPEGVLWLWDGLQRLEALKAGQHKEARVRVQKGDRRRAVLLSLGANAEHGVQRDEETIKRSVYTLMADDQWSGWSKNAVAQTVKIGHRTATKYMDLYRKENPSSKAADPAASGVVTTTRGGKPLTMKTGNLKGPKPKAERNGASPARTEMREPGQDDETGKEKRDQDYLRSIHNLKLYEGDQREALERDALAFRDVEPLLSDLRRLGLKGTSKRGILIGPFQRALAWFLAQATGPHAVLRCMAPGCIDGLVDGKKCKDCRGVGAVAGEKDRGK